jgi:hypothetical protein
MSLKKLNLVILLFISIIQIYAQNFTSELVAGERANPVIADFDGDKTIDFIVVNYYPDGPDDLLLYKNSAINPLEYTSVIFLKKFDVRSNLLSYDFDKDGDTDIIVARDATLDLNVLINDGTGKFTIKALGVSGVFDIGYGDTDKDGDIISLA